MKTHAKNYLLAQLVVLCCFWWTFLSAQESFLADENLSRLQELIESPNRSDALRARNQYRHPLQTLDFFDVRPDLTVVEIWPGGQGGWYRSILGPYITGNGTYIPVRADSDESPFMNPWALNTSTRSALLSGT